MINMNAKNLTLGDEAPKVMWAPLRQVSTSTARGRNVCIRSLVLACDSPFEGYFQELHIMPPKSNYIYSLTMEI